MEIPSSYPYTHSFATPTYENRVTCKDTQGLSVHTFMLPQPVRSQVACGDTQGLSAHTHIHKSITSTCENRVTCRDTQGLSVHTFMLSRLVRSQVACGDTLYGNPHTFRRQKCLRSLHAFKGAMSSHFEDKNFFSHCMPSKDDNVFICILKTTMSSPQKLQYLFPLCFVGLDVLCLYT